jgi:hypothetical protein
LKPYSYFYITHRFFFKYTLPAFRTPSVVRSGNWSPFKAPGTHAPAIVDISANALETIA